MLFDAPADVSAETEALVLDLVEWIAKEPRAYDTVMDAWRTFCPRLPVWETACDRAYLARINGEVRVTAEGLALMREAGSAIAGERLT